MSIEIKFKEDPDCIYSSEIHSELILENDIVKLEFDKTPNKALGPNYQENHLELTGVELEIESSQSGELRFG